MYNIKPPLYTNLSYKELIKSKIILISYNFSNNTGRLQSGMCTAFINITTYDFYVYTKNE